MKRTIAALIGVLLVALEPGDAHAHASLVRSDPAPNSFLQRSPATLTVTFSEPVDPRSTTLRLLDTGGQPLATGTLSFADDGLTVSLDPGELSAGIYNVVWSNVSTFDGHALRGSFPFTVLRPDGSLPDEVNTVATTGTDPDQLPNADNVAVRLLSLVGLVVTAGAVILLVLWPGTNPAEKGLGRMLALGGALLVIATLLNLAVLRDTYVGLSLSELVFHTRNGGYLLARLSAAGLVLLALLVFPDARRKAASLGLVGVGVFLWSLAATSHGAASVGGSWASVFDGAHRLAAVCWIGAVAGLAVSARLSGKRADYRTAMPRFSLLASVAVMALLVTGTISGMVEVDSWNSVATTNYGLILAAKLAAAVPLLAVAGYNARWGRRRLMQLAPGEPGRFIATAGLEIALGLAVFVGAAFLTQTVVPKALPREDGAQPFVTSAVVDDLSVELRIEPNRPGLNTYRVKLSDRAGKPVDAQRVRLTFNYLDDPSVGPATLTLSPERPGLSSGRGPFLILAGRWRVDAEVRRLDVDDAMARFEVVPQPATTITSNVRAGGWANPAAGLTMVQFAGVASALVLLGLGGAVLVYLAQLRQDEG